MATFLAAPSNEDIREAKDINTTDTVESYSPLTTSEAEKFAQDGHNLVPQPTTDPKDPLNWSVLKKHLFLIIIAVTAFLPDYGSSTGAITNLVQPESVFCTFKFIEGEQ